MNGLVEEWVSKAEADARTAEREALATDEPNWDAVCFHAQQCIEKYLKGLLQHQGTDPPRTHDLWRLATLLTRVMPELEQDAEKLEWLSVFAVEFRYPGEEAGRAEAELAIGIMRRLRPRLREQLGLS